jgi:transposase
MKRPDQPRLLSADRSQLEFRTFDLESTLSDDHRARVLWAMVERLDLGAFHAEIEARGSEPGRPAIDPKILLCLWLYATAEGVGSARAIERYTSTDAAFRWICGGVSVGYRTLSSFRVAHGAKLDALMAQVLATMMRAGLVRLVRVAHDGMRVRASAGAASFRRDESLERCLIEAKGQIERLSKEILDDPAAHTARERASRERAAADRLRRVEQALAELPKVAEVKRRNRGKKGKVSPPRVSTTDPESRVMKMADGGFRPAFNVQLATDVDSRVIVGVGLTNRGSDLGEVKPMLEKIEAWMGRRPTEYLADGGFADHKSIDAVAASGGQLYAPPIKPAKARATGAPPTHRDSAAVAEWRARMETDEAKLIYRQRAATAETVNADLREWRTLACFRVRGKAKALAHTLMNALTYNLLRWQTLEAAA